eukprot:103163-Prorocentrum_minimum.AAC.1
MLLYATPLVLRMHCGRDASFATGLSRRIYMRGDSTSRQPTDESPIFFRAHPPLASGVRGRGIYPFQVLRQNLVRPKPFLPSSHVFTSVSGAQNAPVEYTRSGHQSHKRRENIPVAGTNRTRGK